MGIKSKEVETVELSMNDKIKPKRGRKSKKELLTALNVESLVKKIDTKKINQTQIQNTINLNIQTHLPFFDFHSLKSFDNISNFELKNSGFHIMLFGL